MYLVCSLCRNHIFLQRLIDEVIQFILAGMIWLILLAFTLIPDRPPPYWCESRHIPLLDQPIRPQADRISHDRATVTLWCLISWVTDIEIFHLISLNLDISGLSWWDLELGQTPGDWRGLRQ